MDEYKDAVADSLSGIYRKLSSIDTILEEQFHTAKGFTWKAEQNWRGLGQALEAVANPVLWTTLAVIVIAVAVLAHVIHHW